MTYAGFVIPVYNTRPEALRRTLNDLLERTTLPIYVVDDGSMRKETLDLLRAYEKVGQVEVIYHERNKGKIEALHTGVKQGNVTYPFFIDDDVSIKVNSKNKDKSLDNIINEEINYLSQNENVVCTVYPVGARNLDESFLTRIQHLEHIIPTYFVRKMLNSGLYVGGSGSLWKSDKFEQVYNFHSKEHEGDDLETTLAVYELSERDGKGLTIHFSDNLILLADLEPKFKNWFKQRLKWEYGKWRLLPKYYKQIMKNPHIFAYYFASVALASSIISFIFFSKQIPPETVPLLYSGLLLLSIGSERPYRWSNSNRLKESAIHMPYIGLLSAYYPPALLVAPLYTYAIAETIYKMYGLPEDPISQDASKRIGIVDALGLFAYSMFYLVVLQPAGMAYSAYRKLKSLLEQEWKCCY